MLAARRSRLSFAVHAIDDSGSLCHARPLNGRWLRTERLPINCPRCLVRLSRPRYALCEGPSASLVTRQHIRLLGPDGLKKGGVGGARALCGAIIGWDLALVTPEVLKDPALCASCLRGLDAANSVR